MKKIRRAITILLVVSLTVCGCRTSKISDNKGDLINIIMNDTVNYEDYNISNLSDDSLLQYVEDSVYYELIGSIEEGYFIENVSTQYISKEYIEELEYNSKANIYFGYTLSELESQFEGGKYVFTLGENNTTVVKEFESYDDTFEKSLNNIAIGAGVILVCVTVSAVTAGAPAVSTIFAMSAKTATSFAVSGGLVSGVTSGIIEGIKTGDFDQALKVVVRDGSEAFKWGAITGAISGGASETIALKGATRSGLTMNEAALIQKEAKYPLNVIKSMRNADEAKIYQKQAGLVAKKVNGKTALVRNIDLNYKSDLAGETVTNLERMKRGYAAIDPATGKAYELHHVGQKIDSPLAILTKNEHISGGNNTILHDANIADGNGVHSLISNEEWTKQKKEFWKGMYELYAKNM